MHDALVVGGGLAGSSLAIRLARAGRSVLLLEKERQAHHKVCGEFLSGEALGYLQELSVDLPALGALPITKLRLVSKRSFGETTLAFAAQSLSRYVLDEALLGEAGRAGVEVVRGERVTGLEDGAARTQENRYDAKAIFLASGKHDLRGWQRPGGTQPNLIGFKMHWRVTRATAAQLRGAIELTLFPGGYAGLQMIDAETANLALLVQRSQFSSWADLLASMKRSSEFLAGRLAGAEALWQVPLAVSSIPYGFVTAREDRVWRLGDQAAVIPSFSGSGMSIALHSAALAARVYLAGEKAGEYHARIRRDLKRRVWLATAISKAFASPACEPWVRGAVRLVPRLLSIGAATTRVPLRVG